MTAPRPCHSRRIRAASRQTVRPPSARRVTSFPMVGVGKLKVGSILLWTASSLAAVYFVFIGAEKFTSPFWLTAFARWGYSDRFRMLIGVVEIAGGLLLAFPKTTVYGAVAIEVVMLGALGTRLRCHEHVFAPVFLLVMVALIAYGRRRHASGSSRRIPAEVDPV